MPGLTRVYVAEPIKFPSGSEVELKFYGKIIDDGNWQYGYWVSPIYGFIEVFGYINIDNADSNRLFSFRIYKNGVLFSDTGQAWGDVRSGLPTGIPFTDIIPVNSGDIIQFKAFADDSAQDCIIGPTRAHCSIISWNNNLIFQQYHFSRVYRNSSLSLGIGETLIPFDSMIVDYYNCWNLSTGIWTSPTDGLLHVHANCTVPNNSNSALNSLILYINDINVCESGKRWRSAASSIPQRSNLIDIIYPIQKDDTLKIYWRTNNTATVLVTGSEYSYCALWLEPYYMTYFASSSTSSDFESTSLTSTSSSYSESTSSPFESSISTSSPNIESTSTSSPAEITSSSSITESSSSDDIIPSLYNGYQPDSLPRPFAPISAPFNIGYNAYDEGRTIEYMFKPQMGIIPASVENQGPLYTFNNYPSEFFLGDWVIPNVLGDTVLYPNAATPYNFTDEKWHRVSIVYSYNNLGVYTQKRYIDGVLASPYGEYSASFFLPHINDTLPIVLFSDTDRLNVNTIKWRLADLRIWSDARTETEINTYKKYGTIKGNEENLVGLWLFDEETGNIAYDIAGHAADITNIVDEQWYGRSIGSFSTSSSSPFISTSSTSSSSSESTSG